MEFLLTQSAAQVFIAATSLIMLIAFFRPLLALRIYFILRPITTPYTMWHFTMFGLPIGTPHVLILTVGGFFSVLGKGTRLAPGMSIWLYLYLIFCLPSLFLSPSPSTAISVISKFTAGIGAYLIAYNYVNNLKDVKKFLYTVVFWSAAIPFAYGFYQFFTATGNVFTHEFHDPRRIASVFAHYNAYGEYLNIIIFLLIAMLSSPHFTKQRNWLLLLLGTAAAQAILSQNRGAWIGLVLGLLWGMFLYRKVIAIKFLALGGALVGLLAGAYVIQRFAVLAETSVYGTSQNTLQGRFAYYDYLIDFVMESPIFGQGLGWVPATLEQAPHNDYLWILLETGVLSLLMYIFFHLSTLLTHVKNRNTRNWRWLQLSLCGINIYFFIHSFVQNIIWNPSVLPFFMACLGLSAKLMVLSEDESTLKQI